MIEHLHIANVAIHVLCGLTALGIALWILSAAKGGPRHIRRGRWFVRFMGIVVATAAIGAVFFRAAPTLVAITTLATYYLVSGVRAASGRAPGGFDTALAAATFVGGGAFVGYLSTGAPAFWRPQVTFPIGVTLMLVAGYDLVRLAAPNWRARIRPLEHGVKMIFAFGALVSAGLGTVAPQWQPWSQVGPSVVITAFAVAYVLIFGKAALAKAQPIRPE